MGTPPTASGHHWLELHRVLRAARERVFQAWTSRDALSSWFAPFPGAEVIVQQLDLHPGGAYRIEARHPTAGTRIATGVYHTIRPPESLSFTWSRHPSSEITVVLVTLVICPEGTDLTLEHGGFTAQSDLDSHRADWTFRLDRLEAFVADPTKA